MAYKVTKRYGHENGWTTAFRQWRTPTHCRFIHGYPFAFELTFSADTLDARNWVIGFGDLKEIKQWMQETFDHTMIVAEDDPELEFLRTIEAKGLTKIVMMPHVGCEKVAEYVFNHVQTFLLSQSYCNNVSLESVRVQEHPGNGVLFTGASA